MFIKHNHEFMHLLPVHTLASVCIQKCTLRHAYIQVSIPAYTQTSQFPMYIFHLPLMDLSNHQIIINFLVNSYILFKLYRLQRSNKAPISQNINKQLTFKYIMYMYMCINQTGLDRLVNLVLNNTSDFLKILV